MSVKAFAIFTISLLFGAAVGYLVINNTQQATHYIEQPQPITSSSGGSGYIVPHPKLTAYFAYKNDCLYCQTVNDHLHQYIEIIKKYNVDIESEKKQFEAYLKKLDLDYKGVPTVLIGHYAFYSYQKDHNCPSYTTEVEVKIKDRTVKLCRINNSPHYYVYIPDRVEDLIEACKATNDQSCFLN